MESECFCHEFESRCIGRRSEEENVLLDASNRHFEPSIRGSRGPLPAHLKSFSHCSSRIVCERITEDSMI